MIRCREILTVVDNLAKFLAISGKAHIRENPTVGSRRRLNRRTRVITKTLGKNKPNRIIIKHLLSAAGHTVDVKQMLVEGYLHGISSYF